MLQTRGNKLTWLGHAAFRITTPTGNVILVDPWIQTNPMTPEALKKIDRVDTMLITHGHFDHIADAVELGKEVQAARGGDPRNRRLAGIQGRLQYFGHE